MFTGSRHSWRGTTKFTAPNSAACSITRWLRRYMSLPHRAAAVAVVLFCVLVMPATPPALAAEGGPTSLTLYGDAGRGWGLNTSQITGPGPTITVFLGYPVTLTLVGADPPPAQVTHNWFIDYDGNNLT